MWIWVLTQCDWNGCSMVDFLFFKDITWTYTDVVSGLKVSFFTIYLTQFLCGLDQAVWLNVRFWQMAFPVYWGFWEMMFEPLKMSEYVAKSWTPPSCLLQVGVGLLHWGKIYMGKNSVGGHGGITYSIHTKLHLRNIRQDGWCAHPRSLSSHQVRDGRKFKVNSSLYKPTDVLKKALSYLPVIM